jgi:ATP-binding cassette subfamily F protein uup
MPANLLILDEPTNDLDLETLELLENLLLDFKGTLILVSHDRAFLNNLVTSTLVLQGDGLVREYIGGYDDWYQLSQEKLHNANSENDKKNPGNKTQIPSGISTTKKLNFMQKKKLLEELDHLPEKIESLETEYHQTIQKMSSSEFYNQEEKLLTETASRLKWLEDEIAHTYQRWQDVEHLLAENES